MNEAPPLIDLSAAAQSAYPDAPPAIAVLATAQPELLDTALGQVAQENEALQSLEDAASRVHDLALSKPADSNAPLSQFKAARAALDVQDLRADYQSSVALAEEVSLLRRKLARPMRIAVTVLSALVCAGGIDGTIYEVQKSHPLTQMSAEYTYILEGVLGVVSGGFLGRKAGRDLAGTEARRRARRQAS